MSINKIKGGVRVNRAGVICHGNGEALTELELQALPVVTKKNLGIKKIRPKPKARVAKPGTYIEETPL